MASGGIPQAHLDALAQQQGFPSYAAWAAWNANRIASVHAPAPQGGPAPQNWMQRALTSIPGTPANLLDYVSNRLHSALGGQ